MDDVQRLKAIYNFEKADRLPRKEFGIWESTKKRWRDEGWNGDESIFIFDKTSGLITPSIDLGHMDIPICPGFEKEVIETTEKYEFVRLHTGEVRMYPIGQRDGFQFVLVRAPVHTEKDWYETIKPRLDPKTPQRWTSFHENMNQIQGSVQNGKACLSVKIIGGYMFLRSLCGSQKLLYMFYDTPGLLLDMMETWLHFNLYILKKIQKQVSIFRLYMIEDAAYKTSPLISPNLAEEFLLPYYQQLIQALRSKQKETLHVELDCDGNPEILLPYYIKNGFTAWSPCEVVAGCDVVALARQFPSLVIIGGIDKSVLAADKPAIKKEIDRIIPFLKSRGGYIPTCDGEVPDNVPFENYVFYRQYITSIDNYTHMH